MKNILTALIAALVVCSVVSARAADSYSSTGTAPLNFVIAAGDGQIVADSMIYSATSNSTITVYRPRGFGRCSTAASGVSNLVVYTTGSNSIAGVALVEDTDYVLVRNDTSGYQLEKVGYSISYPGTNQTVYVLQTTTTADVGDAVYFIDASDNLSIPEVAAQSGVNIGSVFTGYNGMPVYLNIPGLAGTTTITGTYHLEE